MYLQALEMYWYWSKNKCKPHCEWGRSQACFCSTDKLGKSRDNLIEQLVHRLDEVLSYMNDKTINYKKKNTQYFLQQKHVVIRGWVFLLSQLKRRTRLQFQLTQRELIVCSHNVTLEIICILHVTLYFSQVIKNSFTRIAALYQTEKIS